MSYRILRTAWVTREMAKHVRNCIPVEDACDIVGITKDRHYAWIRDGKAAESDDPEHPTRELASLKDGEVVTQREYMVALRAARAEGKALLLTKIRDAGKKDWRALAWVGEKIYQELAPRVRQEVSGPDGGPIELASVQSINDRLKTFVERLAADVESQSETAGGDVGPGQAALPGHADR